MVKMTDMIWLLLPSKFWAEFWISSYQSFSYGAGFIIRLAFSNYRQLDRTINLRDMLWKYQFAEKLTRRWIPLVIFSELGATLPIYNDGARAGGYSAGNKARNTV